MLTHQLTLVLHHSSMILYHKGLVHHPLDILKISDLQSIGQPIIHAVQETLLFLLISVDFIGCHTPFREKGNEASIRVPRMFKSHAWQQYDKQMQCY
jgi:hypothetical protein